MDSASLILYRDRGYLEAFVSFLRGRGAGPEHIVKHLSMARKVSDWLDAINGTVFSRKRQREAEIQWQHNIARDLRDIARKDPTSRSLPSAQILFRFVENIVQQAKYTSKYT